MALKGQDFEVAAGDAVALLFPITDTAGDPVDVSGDTLRWALAKDATDAEPLILKTSADGITVAGYDNNEVTIVLDAEDTRGLRGKYHHELEVDQAAGPSTLAEGTATIRPELVRT